MSSFVPSERTIHDGLLKKCDGMVSELRRNYKREKDSTAIAWVSRDIRDDAGNTINDFVLLELPEDRTGWMDILLQLIQKTDAFALLVVDRQQPGLKVVFESRFGARSWTLKEERHGDVDVLSKPIVLDDVESIGLLWTSSRGEA